MDIRNWEFNDSDRELAQELRSFIPEKVYDMHMHVYRSGDLHEPDSGLTGEGPAEAGIAGIRAFYEQALGRPGFAGGLAIAYPAVNCDIRAINAYVAAQIADEPDCRGAICITPHDSPEEISGTLDEHPKIVGLKPYHVFSDTQPSWDASPLQYMPEWAWKLAHERGLLITLHLVRDGAAADPENIRQITEMLEKYPNARLILAHAGRCFHAPNALKGLPQLKGLANLWFDMSAICEPEPLDEIIRLFGPGRLMWGSDYPVCMIRGRAVTLGLDFIWLQSDTVAWDRLGTKCRPVLVGLESLRALRTASRNTGLGREELNDIFCRNAERLLFPDKP